MLFSRKNFASAIFFAFRPINRRTDGCLVSGLVNFFITYIMRPGLISVISFLSFVFVAYNYARCPQEAMVDIYLSQNLNVVGFIRGQSYPENDAFLGTVFGGWE